jgi:hypothetical protein
MPPARRSKDAASLRAPRLPSLQRSEYLLRNGRLRKIANIKDWTQLHNGSMLIPYA